MAEEGASEVLVHIIADYGQGDLAFAEVVQRLKVHLPDAEPMLVPVPAFATLAAGFCVAQLGLQAAPPGTMIYHNVAPRQDDPAVRAGNEGERLAFARLPTGVRVIGVNAGYAFSFIKDVAEELRWIASPAEGSQFRSRDLFPQAAAAIALGVGDMLGDDINEDALPEPPSSVVAYVDGYGNIKTTIPYQADAVASGERVQVEINQRRHEAVISDGAFAVREGQLAFAPGSSGWRGRDGAQVQWIEIFLRGGNAWELFDRPPIGAKVTAVCEVHKLSLLALAEVQASSEADGHPLLLAFDEGVGPGATYWKAGDQGEQTVTVTFREPCALERVTLEVEEREIARTQEVQVAFSTDGGLTYREVLRQEFTFSPGGATWEQENWRVQLDDVTNVRLVIKPDKGRQDVYATITSFQLWGRKHDTLKRYLIGGDQPAATNV